jgi:hypothetical protein
MPRFSNRKVVLPTSRWRIRCLFEQNQNSSNSQVSLFSLPILLGNAGEGRKSADHLLMQINVLITITRTNKQTCEIVMSSPTTTLY